MLANQQSNLMDLSEVYRNGDDSLIKGVARGFLKVAKTVVDTGVEIFEVISNGGVKLTNETANAVTELGEEVFGIFDFASGGISVFCLYILNLAIIAYLGYKHLVERRIQRDYITQNGVPSIGRNRPVVVPVPVGTSMRQEGDEAENIPMSTRELPRLPVRKRSRENSSSKKGSEYLTTH